MRDLVQREVNLEEKRELMKAIKKAKARIKELESINFKQYNEIIRLNNEVKRKNDLYNEECQRHTDNLDKSLTPEEAKGIIEENRKKYKGHNIPLNSAYVNSFLIETFKKKGVEL